MIRRPMIMSLLSLVLMMVLVACGGDESGGDSSDSGGIPAGAVEISIIYAPESDAYMQQIIPAFNDAYRRGVNPVTGAALGADEQIVYVTGAPGSSGTIAQSIVNAVTNPNSANAARPTIFQPSVSHWLALANFQSGRDLFDMTDVRATAYAPVVMAIWESRLRAIQETVGYDEIGWAELLDVLNSPNGWQDYGIVDGRRTVYYGHTDPFVSSTALSTLIMEFYASAREENYTERRLNVEMVEDEAVREGVRQIEELIRHYSRRTTEFRNYIAQGPEYLDFVALEENDLIAINRGEATFQPPEPLIALYPAEGTFWHEHPFAVPDAPWVSTEQRSAARTFGDYVLLVEQQELIMGYGFRPVNPDVEIGLPFTEENGVSIDDALNVPQLDVPDPAVIASVQESWEFVKKQADIMLVIDVSGSMEGEKLENAKAAAQAFIENTGLTNRVGLAAFAERVEVLVELDILENNKSDIAAAINRLQAGGGTALYNATVDTVGLMSDLPDSDRIRALILLSDGEDTCQGDCRGRSDAVTAIEASSNALNPVIVVPVGYGDISVQLERELGALANASNTIWVPGNPDNINELLELISSFF
ncbi:MAG: VWA domain-containing protein [Aggregatilineales bacterium]